ncbi:hypothetical protein CN692_19470 [Bacillus sp. AFS002410]|nr:hypothetical protein CN692_19470 [Bacillus sp. AFS002410]
MTQSIIKKCEQKVNYIDKVVNFIDIWLFFVDKLPILVDISLFFVDISLFSVDILIIERTHRKNPQGILISEWIFFIIILFLV